MVYVVCPLPAKIKLSYIFVGNFRLPDLGPDEDAKRWYKILLPVWLGSGEGVGEVVGCSILVPVYCHGSVPLVVPAIYANEK